MIAFWLYNLVKEVTITLIKFPVCQWWIQAWGGGVYHDCLIIHDLGMLDRST